MTVPRKKAEPQEAASIEEDFARLEEIIKRLEAGAESLEETFAGYEYSTLFTIPSILPSAA